MHIYVIIIITIHCSSVMMDLYLEIRTMSSLHRTILYCSIPIFLLLFLPSFSFMLLMMMMISIDAEVL